MNLELDEVSTRPRDRRRPRALLSASATLIAVSLLGGCSCGDDTAGGGAGGSGGAGGDGGSAGAPPLGGGGEGGAGGGPLTKDPVLLASGRVNPQAIAVYGDDVIWTEFGDGANNTGGVLRCSKAGCLDGPTTVSANQPFPSSLALHGTDAYWADRSSDDTLRCSLDAPCDAPTVVVSGASIQWGIALDDDAVYFTVGGDENGDVSKCPLSGCDLASRTTIATLQNRPQDIAVDGGEIFWTTIGTPPSFADGRVNTCPTSGCVGEPTAIAVDQTVSALALDATRVYWAVDGGLDSKVFACPRTGCSGDGPELIADGLTFVGHMAVDASGIYWSELGVDVNAQEGRIASCPLDGCAGAPARVHATEQDLPRGIAVDETSIYWVNGFGGTVYKVAK